jgi:hypothetical protein
MLTKEQWRNIEALRGDDCYDFSASSEEDLKSFEKIQISTLRELERVYAAYRKIATGRSWGLGVGATHDRMREQGIKAAKAMISSGVTPTEVLRRIDTPKLAEWSGLTIVPWSMFTSDKMIAATTPGVRRGRGFVPVVAETHSFTHASDRLHPKLRAKIRAKWGSKRLAEIGGDNDDSLYVNVQARAVEYRVNNRLYIPAKYVDIVIWLAGESWL